jgi:hypothetical protein
MPAARKPQINFQVETCLKTLYEEAKASGHFVTRLCAAGLLMLVQDDQLRIQALNRLRDWEEEYADASAARIRAFVQGAAGALRTAGRGRRPARRAPRR